MTLPGAIEYERYAKWFWIVILYDTKRDILINGMILSGIHCTSQKLTNGRGT